MKKKKILVIRFSSIGDIVLTSPILRCIKNQMPDTELHFITKFIFEDTLKHNPHIDKLFTFKNDIEEIVETLQKEQYDLLIDLHYNLRSYRLKRKLGAKSFHFSKLNIKKFVAVNFKKIDMLPKMHIVDRYFKAVESLGVKNDGLGLEYYIDKKDELDLKTFFKTDAPEKFIALVVGGSYYTKQIPLNKLKEICDQTQLPIILMGGKADEQIASELTKYISTLINTCGKLSLNQSASILKQAEWVITSDTGLMHIASAFNKKIISVWGNTIPEFGMSPYMPHSQNRIIEQKKLSCRPCSKLGYKKCPVGHFNCMNHHDFTFVKELV